MDLFEAIASGDPAHAQRACDRHLEQAIERVVATLALRSGS